MLNSERKRSQNLPMNSIPKWSAVPKKACKRKKKRRKENVRLKSKYPLCHHLYLSIFYGSGAELSISSGPHSMSISQKEAILRQSSRV